MPGQSTMLEPVRRRVRAWRGPFALWREDMRDVISNLFAEDGEGPFGGRLIPSLDVSETADAVQVRMDIPGVKAADIDIQVNGDLLTISGKREEEKEEKGRTYRRVERTSGSFSRTVTLPSAVDEAKVDAQYHDGILTIALPKTAEAKALKIKVKS